MKCPSCNTTNPDVIYRDDTGHVECDRCQRSDESYQVIGDQERQYILHNAKKWNMDVYDWLVEQYRQIDEWNRESESMGW